MYFSSSFSERVLKNKNCLPKIMLIIRNFKTRWISPETVSHLKVVSLFFNKFSLLQDYRADIDARAPSYHLLQRQADALIGADHPSAKEIDAAIQEVSKSVENLEK